MKKTVVILLRSVDVIGGTEIQTLNLGKALTDSGYEVILNTFFMSDFGLLKLFTDEGIQVNCNNLRADTSLYQLFFVIRQYLKKTNPDIVHIQYMNPGFIPILAAWSLGIKNIVGNIHQPATYYKLKHRLIVNLASKFCKYFISVSLNTQASWFKINYLYKKGVPTNNNMTIYNCLPFYFGQNQMQTNKSNNNKSIKFGVVGRLRWEKGQLFAIESFAKSCEELEDIELHLVGIGPDYDLLLNVVKSMKYKHKIFFYGQMMPDELMLFYQGIDVLIVPSKYEAFGLTAIEGMFFGCPVIASNVDGLKEIIVNDYNGYLFNQNRQEDLANKIKKLASNTNLIPLMGENAQTHVEENFSFHQYSTIINHLYKNFK